MNVINLVNASKSCYYPDNFTKIVSDSMPKGAKHRGRQKGTLNKVTADIKAMVLQAMSEVGGRIPERTGAR